MTTTEETQPIESLELETQETDEVTTTGEETPFDIKEEKPFDPNAELRDEKGLFLGKYKEMKDVLKGYRELSKKIQEKSPEAPEGSYEVTFDEESGLEFNPEDPLWKKVEPMFREAKLPNDVVQSLVMAFTEHMNGPIADLEEEKQKLGVKADERIGNVDTFWLGKDIPEKFSSIVPLLKQTATGIEFLEFAMEGRTEKNIPVSPSPLSQATIEENKQRVFDWKDKQADFTSNPYKQQVYDQQLYKALKGQPISV